MFTHVLVATAVVAGALVMTTDESRTAPTCCAKRAYCCRLKLRCCPKDVGENSKVNTTEGAKPPTETIALPTCCAKRAYCCSIKARCCGKSATEEVIAVAMNRSSSAVAQSNAKERFGKAYWENRYSSQQTQHARNYASNLYRYSAVPIRIAPQFLKAQSEECGRNLAASQKNLVPVEKAVKGDKELETRVASIRKHLANASEHYKKMHTECCKTAVDRKATMSCCNDLIGSLDSASKESAALERMLLRRTARAPSTSSAN